ncbi:MAG TPA: vitamin K epoxide reductase family protein [Microbacteriaceae bacterium]|nr:vitamin K epoxide reductase family protein [Microbacteriaceae bacterium]
MTFTEVSKSNSKNKNFIVFGVISILLGLIGWFASFELLTEYLKSLIEPDYTPNCNVSVLVTCGPNMGSWQGSVLGFSNTIIGVSAFVAPIIIGFSVLAGANFKPWFWRLYVLGLAFGYIFITWLSYQSIFALNTLCPWCMVVWLAMIPLWWGSSSRLLANGQLGFSDKFRSLGLAIHQWAWVIILLNIIVIATVAQFKLNWLFTEFGIGSY